MAFTRAFSRPADRGLFQISTPVRGDVVDKALTAILVDLSELQKNGVTADELNAKKNRLDRQLCRGAGNLSGFCGYDCLVSPA